MRPTLIVIPSPSFDLLFCFVDRFEPVRIEAFIAQSTIERFHVGVIGWLARSASSRCERGGDRPTGPGVDTGICAGGSDCGLHVGEVAGRVAAHRINGKRSGTARIEGSKKDYRGNE